VNGLQMPTPRTHIPNRPFILAFLGFGIWDLLLESPRR
jgi:hypothetical protein